MNLIKDGTPLACDGVTTRDYFAAMALQGLLSSRTAIQFALDSSSPTEMAYWYADEMLRERSYESSRPSSVRGNAKYDNTIGIDQSNPNESNPNQSNPPSPSSRL